jgi:hypothetical protein
LKGAREENFTTKSPKDRTSMEKLHNLSDLLT